MLRYKASRIDDIWEYRISELFYERVDGNPIGPALIVAEEVLHVLEEECRRPFDAEHLCDIKKQRALCLAGKSMCTAERPLLRYPG